MSSYTPEETAAVIKAVTLAGMAVSIADMGIVSTAIEAGALAQEIVGAAKKYPANSIVQSVFSAEAVKSNSPKAPEGMTPDNLVDTAMTAINEAVAIVTAKATPAEVEEYKQFIYAAAEHVANAAGEGLFGTGSTKVSAKESATLIKLKAALSV
ncbi:MAG: hypothetical protein LH647_20970 [Leptolyngbyaceae cyanobacterium CAN_BIN12]|nr:hypothetical protein [Leptolyngbyaceae cyanobacterium CAN_BIN12]